MGYRERQSLKKFLAEEKEAQEKPIREAEAKLKATHVKLLEVQRDTLLNPKVQDADLWVDPAVNGKSMPETEAIKFNVEHLQAFCKGNPDFAVTDRNLETLGDYLHRHGIVLATSEMLTRLYVRMRSAGVEFDRPEPKPQPAPTPQPQARPSPKPAQPQMHTGRDFLTGKERQFTEREVNRMSSLEYRRAFAVLPDVGSLFTALSDQRQKQ